MNWFQDEFDEAYNELIYEPEKNEDEEEDETAMYFDVPLPYRPIQYERRKDGRYHR